MDYIISDKVYDVLKWLCVLVLPAASTLVKALGGAWGWDSGLCEAVATTLTAVSAFAGVVLGLSAATAKPSAPTDEKGA